MSEPDMMLNGLMTDRSCRAREGMDKPVSPPASGAVERFVLGSLAIITIIAFFVGACLESGGN